MTFQSLNDFDTPASDEEILHGISSVLSLWMDSIRSQSVYSHASAYLNLGNALQSVTYMYENAGGEDIGQQVTLCPIEAEDNPLAALVETIKDYTSGLCELAYESSALPDTLRRLELKGERYFPVVSLGKIKEMVRAV